MRTSTTAGKHLILAATAVAFIGGCSPLVNLVSFFPSDYELSPDRRPAAAQPRTVVTADRRRLQAYYFPAVNGGLVLLFFHGNAGNLDMYLPDLERLNRFGPAVLAIAYRGYGTSTGRPSERGIYRDGEAAYLYARDTLGFPADSIVVLGRSLGTAVAVRIASAHQVAGIVLVTPMTTARQYARYHGFGPLSILGGRAWNNLGRIGAITAPLVIIHGTDDRTAPYWMAERLLKASGSPRKALVTVEGADHNDVEFAQNDLYWRAIEAFLDSL